MFYILRNKTSTLEKFWYGMHHTIFCSHKMFYLFFVIRTGGTKPTWKNEQNRSSTLGPRNLNHMDNLRYVFTSTISSNSCMDFVF